MIFVILGGGSLGSVYGGLLDIAGHDVTLVARSQNYEALKSDGLTINTSNGQVKRKVKVVASPMEVDTADVAFLTVKGRDTHRILEDSRHLFGKTVFISLQNAAGKDEVLAQYAGVGNVIGGVSTVGATLIRPGVVDYTEVGYNWLGELPRGRSERVEKIVKILNEAKIPTTHAADISAIKWSKLVLYCANAGIAALTRLPSYQFLQDQKITGIFVRLVKEGGSVMKAVGVEPENHPHLLPIKRMMELDEEPLLVELADRAKRIPESERRVTISMLQDVWNHKELEVEETFGYMAKAAKELKVETPTFSAIYALVAGLNSHILSVQPPERDW